MPNWTLPDDKIDALKRLNSSYRIRYIGGLPHAEIVDNVTKEIYVEGVSGTTEEDAVCRAVDMAHKADKPLTSAQLVQRNRALEQEVAKLKASRPNAAAVATAK